jgi:hypothetical protein
MPGACSDKNNTCYTPRFENDGMEHHGFDCAELQSIRESIQAASVGRKRKQFRGISAQPRTVDATQQNMAAFQPDADEATAMLEGIRRARAEAGGSGMSVSSVMPHVLT